MARELRIGVAGLGTVGAGVLRLLAAHGEMIAERAGRLVRVAAMSARDHSKDRGVALPDARWVDDATALADAPDVDLVLDDDHGADTVLVCIQ